MYAVKRVRRKIPQKAELTVREGSELQYQLVPPFYAYLSPGLRHNGLVSVPLVPDFAHAFLGKLQNSYHIDKLRKSKLKPILKTDTSRSFTRTPVKFGNWD